MAPKLNEFAVVGLSLVLLFNNFRFFLTAPPQASLWQS